MRITKRLGNQFWQVASIIDEHTRQRTRRNRQAKITWLAKKFSHILRHIPDMKRMGLFVKAIDIRGVKLYHDQEYRTKRKVWI